MDILYYVLERFGLSLYTFLTAGHNSDGKFIARAQRIEFDCELIPRRVAIFIEKSKDGQIMPVPNVVVRDVACGSNHTVRRLICLIESNELLVMASPN